MTPHIIPESRRPRSQDNMPYNNVQLKEMASGIRGKIRKINQKEGNTPEKFLELINEIGERVKHVGLDWDRLISDRELKELRDRPCMSQQASQDNRMQISRWTNDGKEKKIYVYWDLYIMFNFIDEGRRRHSNPGLSPGEHLKPQNLYQKYCQRNTPGDESRHHQCWVGFLTATLSYKPQ